MMKRMDRTGLLVDDMLKVDGTTVEELKAALEQRRLATHQLIMMLPEDERAQYAPCSGPEYASCPVRCAAGVPQH